ncbi:hypothetical protein HYT24_02480 [Candidatus Pacearchaeota archaeon]|nr:hypothetical protein [Candidatus Pacearchaeota archaeon]
MINKINKKENLKFLLLLAVLQGFLLVNMAAADSYLISSSYQSKTKTSYSNEFSDLVSDIGKIFISLITIKQIGVVSAQDINNATLQCCTVTNSGALCQDTVTEFISSTSPNSCANPLPTKCSETSMCVTGTCIYNDGLTCAANAPKQACESSKGNWTNLGIFEVPQCQKGACILGNNAQITTKKHCEALSNSQGLPINFQLGMNEANLSAVIQSQSSLQGACITASGSCRFVSNSECTNISGMFYSGTLCSNTDLNTSCKPSPQTKCSNGNVYFLDTCGNLANVYDSSKINSTEYWNSVSQESCTINSTNPAKSCGKCDSITSSQCSSANKTQVDYGSYICKDLTCNDEKGKQRQNGESWCSYDGYVGEGKDLVGSEHWLVSCSNGEVKKNICGNYRSKICQQKDITDGDKTFSIASCIVNEAIKCIDYNGDEDMSKKCNGNSQCLSKNIKIDSKFEFDICLPQYPRGFDMKEETVTGSDVLCSIANTECTVVYVKTLSGGWKCAENCDCEKKEFSEKMNDFCVALGDCGSYINYVGEGTDNINTKGAPEVSWKDYKKYLTPKSGGIQTLTVQQLTESASSAGSVTPLSEGINLAGVQSGLGSAGTAVTATNFLFLKTVGNAYIHTQVMGVSLYSFGAAAAGASIGIIIGQLLIKKLGITGTAATAITVASGVAGATIGLHYAGVQTIYGISTLTIGFIAIAVVVIIIAIGWGKTKTKTVKFTCMPWQAPTGGDMCTKCNGDPSKPCTKYRCESLGQACVLINENTDNPLCQSLKSESTPPKISSGIVLTENYFFKDETTNSVNISGTNKSCIQEFTPAVFTLKTDEYAQCKWSFTPIASYDSMEGFAAEATHYSLNHTFAATGLSLGILEANEVHGNLIDGFSGDMKMYIRCKDYFGNFNLNEYVVNFCINSGPDLTPVIHSLTKTSPANASKLKFGTNTTNFTMWTNEPAECRYDKSKDKDYDSMSNSMSCLTNLSDRQIFGWPCTTTFTNLSKQNSFYIKCRDQPWKTNASERNTNIEDYAYTISVTETNLAINSTYIIYNGARININPVTFAEILGGGSSFAVEFNVETTSGVNNGISTCFYQWGNDSIPFLNTNAKVHKQKFNLINGNYNVSITCRDSVGNEAKAMMPFKLNIDSSAPIVVRAYNEGKLKIVTNEQAKCYASYDNCNFNAESGQAMEIGFTKDHTIAWDPKKIHYIKCKDLFNNTNSGCAIQINPTKFS